MNNFFTCKSCKRQKMFKIYWMSTNATIWVYACQCGSWSIPDCSRESLLAVREQRNDAILGLGASVILPYLNHKSVARRLFGL